MTSLYLIECFSLLTDGPMIRIRVWSKHKLIRNRQRKELDENFSNKTVKDQNMSYHLWFLLQSHSSMFLLQTTVNREENGEKRCKKSIKDGCHCLLSRTQNGTTWSNLFPRMQRVKFDWTDQIIQYLLKYSYIYAMHIMHTWAGL